MINGAPAVLTVLSAEDRLTYSECLGDAMLRAGLAVGLMGTLVLGPPGYADAAEDGVEYQNLRIEVPDGWTVRRIDRGSRECVRFDRHVIYLGRAGRDQLCPAHTAGRTESLHIEPLSAQTDAFLSGLLDSAGSGFRNDRVRRTRVGALSGITVRDPAAGEVRTTLPGAGVLITGSYARRPEDVERVMNGISPAAPRPAPMAARLAHAQRPWVKGRGFDTCAAPSTATMRAWRHAFVAANIYIGGAARSCPDGNLSAGWVRAVRDMGWRLIPTYVGPQAPCGSRRVRFAAGAAGAQGRSAARDAVARARALGIPKHSPIYYDMEAYDRHDANCRRAVLTFLDAWTRRLKRLGYVSGVYSSVASGIRDLGNATGIEKPAAIWYGHWDGRPAVMGDRYLSDSWWPRHRRIKQYRGPHRERHGGVTVNIDSDAVDGPVY